MPVPPVIPAPPETIPNQPSPPPITFAGIGASAPILTGNESPDIVYQVAAQIIATQLGTGADIAIAAANVQERFYKDGAEFYASVYGSAKQAEASRYGADRQLEAEVLRLNTVPAGQLQLQANDLSNRLDLANIQAVSSRYGTDRQAEIGTLEASNRLTADIYQADKNYGASLYGSDRDYQGKVFSAQANKDASVFGSNRDYDGRVYASDRSFAGQVYDADKQYAGVALHETSETDRLTTKLTFADQKFNIVYPVVQASLAASASLRTPDLKSWVDLPFIATSGVLSAAQVQQQVNAAWAKNDSRTQAQILSTQRELAGRGFSSNSPLLEALKVGYIGQNLRANNDAATSIRIETAKANRDAVLAGQKAVADQFNQQQGVALESEKNQVTRQVGLVGALAQLIGGIT